MVAEHAYTFEEFVARLADDDQLPVTFTDEARHVLLHGHCHQKALVGTAPAMRALTLPPNYTLTEVDSGCCGMAGSFGYEKEHYEISMRMAEHRLLPAVREGLSVLRGENQGQIVVLGLKWIQILQDILRCFRDCIAFFFRQIKAIK